MSTSCDQQLDHLLDVDNKQLSRRAAAAAAAGSSCVVVANK